MTSNATLDAFRLDGKAAIVTGFFPSEMTEELDGRRVALRREGQPHARARIVVHRPRPGDLSHGHAAYTTRTRSVDRG